MSEVILPENIEVAELAEVLEVSNASVIRTGFQELGLLLTINQVLPFEEARLLAAHFGYRVRRAHD